MTRKIATKRNEFSYEYARRIQHVQIESTEVSFFVPYNYKVLHLIIKDGAGKCALYTQSQDIV